MAKDSTSPTFPPFLPHFWPQSNKSRTEKKENMPTQDGRKEKVAGMNSCGPNEATNTLNDH